MRLLDAMVLAAAVAICASGCSRLTFVKPSADRGRYHPVAPEYSFSDTREVRQRSQVRMHVVEAARALDAGRVEDAAREAGAALRLDQGSPDALGMMALVEMVRGNDQAAGRHYARAAEVAPRTGRILNDYGAWLCRSGRAAEAIPYFERAIADPGYAARADALANAGACAGEAGLPDRVEPYLRAALQLDPANSVALSAMAQYQYRKGHYLDARAFSQRRLAAAPASPDVLLLASQIEEKMGDRAAAARYREQLGKEFPDAVQLNPGG